MKVNIILIAIIALAMAGVMSSENMTFFMMRPSSAIFSIICIRVITQALWRLQANKSYDLP